MTDILDTLDEQDRLREMADQLPWRVSCAYPDTGRIDYLSSGFAVGQVNKNSRPFILAAVNDSKALCDAVRRLTAENELLRGKVKSLTAAVLEGKPDPVEAIRQLREISGDHWDNVDVDEFMREMRED